MELDEAERYHETYSYGSTICGAIWAIPGEMSAYWEHHGHNGLWLANV